MLRFTSLVLVLATLVPLQAADPTTPLYWSAAKTKELIKEAASKVNPQTGMSPQRFMDSAFMMYRRRALALKRTPAARISSSSTTARA